MKIARAFSGLLFAALICLASPASAQELSPARSAVVAQAAAPSVATATSRNPILSPAKQAGLQESRLSGRSRAHHVIRLTLLLLILLLLINRRRMR